MAPLENSVPDKIVVFSVYHKALIGFLLLSNRDLGFEFSSFLLESE